jgi:uncharacterized protein
MDTIEQPSSLFTVDHMLIKLGKYLRVLGYDATWDEAIRTHELITRANAEDRVFLTRNSRLPDQYPVPSQLLMINSLDPAEQLAQVVAEFQLDKTRWLFTRCIRCNVRLEDIADKKEVEGRVHPNVYGRHEKFFTCPKCATIFWHGSHVENTRRKLGT